MNNLPSKVDVESFRSVLTRGTGLRFDDAKLSFLAEVLATRIKETKSATTAAYLACVASTSQEVARLASILTVSETYFFRDRNQFRALEAVLRNHQSSSPQHLRMLSAGCASGEEAYSLAMAIREVMPDPKRGMVSVTGVDLNPEAIEKARAAAYTSWSMRETPQDIQQKYFHKDGARFALIDVVREMVRFQRENLAGPANGLWRPDAFDIVFCRNVLMYFTSDAARAVVARIARSLAPGGRLFLGHAENLRGLSQDFHLRHTHGTFYYERRATLHSDSDETLHQPEPPARVVEPSSALSPDASWFDAITRASSRIAKLSRDAERDAGAEERRERRTPLNHSLSVESAEDDLMPAMELMKEERFQESLRLLAGTPSSADKQPDILLLRAMLLVSTGSPEGAENLCNEILTIDELNAGAHYVLSICREHAGDRDSSVEHSQSAAYLDSEFAMPHLQLGRLARRSGDTITARRELALALGLLSREDAARIVLFGGGFSRDALIQLCRGELAACGGHP